MKNIREYKAEIERKKKELIQLLKDYCRSQVKLWQQVPALAQKADQLKIYSSGRYQMAYLSHTWPISPSDLGGLRVNLQTGELGPNQCFGQIFGQITLAQLSVITGLLDAEETIKALEEQIETHSATHKNQI